MHSVLADMYIHTSPSYKHINTHTPHSSLTYNMYGSGRDAAYDEDVDDDDGGAVVAMVAVMMMMMVVMVQLSSTSINLNGFFFSILL